MALSCWVVTDGKPGMENQCLGLAEALGLEPLVKRISLRGPWRLFSPYLRSQKAYGPDSDPLTPPWPELLIATGRSSVAASLQVGTHAFRVQIQDPGVSPRHFDLVVVPAHDRLRGENVMPVLGALHRVTPERLAAAAVRFPHLQALPRPRVAVLIGGTNGTYRLTPAVARQLADRLAALSASASLMVTTSRRTGAENEALLRQTLDTAEFWDGVGENPYFAYLAWADAVIVTSESVSMVSEAVATGKPVHLVELEGGSPKFSRFHQSLSEAGMARPFTGILEHWTYAPRNDTALVAAEIKRRLGLSS